MITPSWYNIVLCRSFLGRASRWEVQEQHYDKLQGAFGRMPLVIYLGDFLQLKLVKDNSLIADFEVLVAQSAKKHAG